MSNDKAELLRNQQIANLIKPLVMIVDASMVMFDEQAWREALHYARRECGKLEALPWPATQNKAEDMKHQIAVFQAVFNLYRARNTQGEGALKKPFVDGSDVLRVMGYD